MDRPFVAENARERERMRFLVERLTDEDLRLPLGVDWTIAIALAHLAFWDQRSLFLLKKWKNSGVVEPTTIDIDVTNDSLLSTWRALAPRAAAKLAVSSAGAIDRELDEASSELITKIEGLGEKFRLYRSIHRKQHLDEIEEVLRNEANT